jgi:hypothetical protein
VVGQKNYFPLVLLIPDNHATEQTRGAFLRSGPIKTGDLVSETLTSPLDRRNLADRNRLRQRDGRRIQAEQCVLEAKFTLATAKTNGVTETVRQSPEWLFEHFRWLILISVGQGRFIGSLTDPQMFKFALAASQTAANFPQGIGVCHVAEKHGNQLCPTGEAFRLTFRLMLCHDFSKFGPWEKMR